ncbi:hypothetical protein SKAU_G00114120 [Synaphobranchus kaupii]|uniref:Coiled-coil domain-containing protein n=1 Tax=Synaphobranchus kaupii TaxID=118154 RepID=A0A9Q1G1R0_SYNKA|nr:hypothetical protein SKAU_G00114120 [Synaphobranchus kaupii]
MMAELEIDQSHLPRVQKVYQCFSVLEDGALARNLQEQEIEQHYSSNVQKNQLVQTDLRIAKSLQDEEESDAVLRQATRQLEEQDFEYACVVQEQIQRCAEEARRRMEEEDEEVAKRIQEEEEVAARQGKPVGGCHGNLTGFPLSEGAGLGSQQQVLLDQELAWRLQEEEKNINRKLHRGSRSPPRPQSANPEADFRVAQVAQDKEIARFMQRQEMKSKWRSCDLVGQGSRSELGDLRRGTRERELQVQREELASPSEERTEPPNPANTAHQEQPIRNIAEELDPTFKARQKNISQSGLTSSADLSQAPPTHNHCFHDYTDEPLFIPPTKRQSNKSGRGKVREKEGCKQQ